jgi:DNA invertase Pin-like site-specific DNA recombinase
MTRQAAAYLRRSSYSVDSPGEVSREVQLDTVRGLARADGRDPGSLLIREDWGKSADATKKAKRSAYLALCRAIEAGEVDVVYAYHTDRLYRDLGDFIDLLALTGEKGCRIVTPAGVVGGTGDAMSRAFAQVGAVFGELELNRIKERVGMAFAKRRERGDDLGSRVLYGYALATTPTGASKWARDASVDLAPVRAAVVSTKGNIQRAARMLNDQGVPGPKGGLWHRTPLTRIASREWPELLKPKMPSGTRSRARERSILSGLVTCPCGHIMTPKDRRGAIYCNRGVRLTTAEHGKTSCQQEPILAFLRDQTERLLPTRVTHVEEAQRVALEAEKERLGWSVADGLLTREKAKPRADAINASLRELADLERDSARLRTRVDWSAAPADLNNQLAAAITTVRLGADLRPLAVDWKHETWVVAPGVPRVVLASRKG